MELLAEARKRGIISPAPSEPRPIVLLSDLKIRTKSRELVTLVPNPIQEDYLLKLGLDWRAGLMDIRGIREIILKARQFGFSTLIEGLFFLDTINNENTNTVVLAHDADSTEAIFQMVHTFWEELPAEKRLAKRYSNRREIVFEGTRSSFVVATAGSDGVGRGRTIHNVHGSEAAKWKNPREIVTGLFEAVPADGNIFVETTANGLGNWYHQTYTDAQGGLSVYKPRFYAWFEHPDYQTPLYAPLPPNPDPEEAAREAALRENHGVTDEQLAWRRTKVLTLKADFPQEYPSNAREAFLTSGAKYFDGGALERLSERVESVTPLRLEDGDYPDEGLLFAERAFLEVFALPVAGRQYVVAADTAEGMDRDSDLDYDSADVLDCETWEQVAHLRGQWDTHHFGLMLAELGRWYNTALLGIERNNHGHAVINAAMHTAKYPPMEPGVWSGLYMHEEYDEQRKLSSRKPGWPTTPKTKYFALDGLAASLLSRDVTVNSKGTASELLTFVKLPGGKAGAESGSHDDRVTSLSIGDALLKMRPPQKSWVGDATVLDFLKKR